MRIRGVTFGWPTAPYGPGQPVRAPAELRSVLLVVKGTSRVRGEANRRRMRRARAFRRGTRVAALPLLAALALWSGLGVGSLGSRERELRIPAPTRQPVTSSPTTVPPSVWPLAVRPARQPAP